VSQLSFVAGGVVIRGGDGLAVADGVAAVNASMDQCSEQASPQSFDNSAHTSCWSTLPVFTPRALRS